MVLKSRFHLNLARLVERLPPPVNYHEARPCRIYWKYRGRYAVQLFPGGAIQMIGNIPNDIYSEITTYLVNVLGLTLESAIPTVRSLTVYYHHPHRITSALERLSSNGVILNEREIFPGTLIQHHQDNRRFHTSVFVSGAAIVTGARTLREAYKQLKRCASRHQLFRCYNNESAASGDTNSSGDGIRL